MKVVLKLVILIIAMGVACYGIHHEDSDNKMYNIKWLLSMILSLVLLAIACII